MLIQPQNLNQTLKMIEKVRKSKWANERLLFALLFSLLALRNAKLATSIF